MREDIFPSPIICGHPQAVTEIGCVFLSGVHRLTTGDYLVRDLFG